ncbi:MAG: hypothetical protein IJR40_06840 [Treponema sp.]|nr:hypothetical protein [Treponema sp.]MBQ9626876.1 hypothetical protein [Treponema sp.]
MEKKNLAKRIFMSLFGVIICAISVGVFKIAALGVDPFQSFMAGLDKLIPLDFGLLYIIVNALLLIFALVFDRHYIGIATFINLFLLGYITQFSYQFLQTVIVEPSIFVRAACLVAGVVVICFGSAFYMTADLGVSTYDAVALIIVNTWKKGKFQYVRIFTDIVCVILGAALFVLGGGKISAIPTIAGIGTIITAFFMGPLIEFFNVHVARPLLAK